MALFMPFELYFDIVGSSACDIAPLKNCGNITIGNMNPEIIPYSFVIYSDVCPIFNNTYVIIIGSRNPPIAVIIFPVVVGIDTENISFMFSGSGFISCFLIFIFFGKNNINIIIDIISLIILYNISPVIADVNPYFNRCGVMIIVIVNLAICSNRFDITWGNICSFPKKYPLIIFDSVINGNVILIAIIG